MWKIEIPNDIVFKYVLTFLLVFPFFDIIGFENINNFFYYSYYIIFFASFITLFFITKKENLKISKIQYFIIAFGIILILCTSLNGLAFNNTLYTLAKLVVFSFITEYSLKNDSNAFIRIIKYIFLAYVIANFFTIIFNPNGLYSNTLGFSENWLLGYKNAHITYIITLDLFSFLDDYKSKGKLTIFSYLIFSLGFISTILVKNSTGIVANILILLALIFKKYIRNEKIFNSANYLIAYFTAFISIVLLRLQNIFSFFIVKFLKKDITFTGRTFIWDQVIEKIKSSPLIGYGNITFKYVPEVQTNQKIVTAHNNILDFYFKGGILLTSSYLLILFAASKKLYEFKDSGCAKILALFIFVFCIMSLMEAYSTFLYFFIFVMAYNVKYIVENKK